MQNEFYQVGPELKNTYLSDDSLKELIEKKIPANYRLQIQKHLREVGEKASTVWLEWARNAEENKPTLTQYDEWGRRIDRIDVSVGWKNLEKAAAEEGIVAAAYERKQEEYSRLYQMSLLYLYHPSSAFFSCPLAMTDGAARAIELHGSEDLKANAFRHLTSRDPSDFWTSGQWMTERTGGSDVSGTSTVAEHIEGSDYLLYGTKWFTSATTSQMTFTLAKIREPDGEVSKGLSLFYLEKNNIEVLRLKDKLGTDALPTAELKLVGTRAKLVGGPGEGVKRISSVLNITRIYNSICSISHMRRSLDLAWDYSTKRKAFGAYLSEHALHRKTLNNLEADFKKCFKFTFYLVELLGKEETGKATESERKLLRSLTPIVKLYTAKKCVQLSSEVVESFGGAGYIENTGIPRILRDAQVFPIWEGTTNILALDFLRACEKEGALAALTDQFGLKNLPEVKAENARELVFSVAEQVIESLS
jgi:putative acyl-CoA dehydrogenase